MPRSVQIVRVFTRGDAGGNSLGVLTDITGLETIQMQAIAHELGFSESTFVDWEPGRIPQVRIFTPQVEMEFAGHPLVGTSWVLNNLGQGGVTQMQCPVGMVDTHTEGDVVWIETSLGQPIAQRTDDLLPRAGMPAPARIHTVAMPKEYTVAEYSDGAIVAGLAPVMEVLRETFGLLAFARDGNAVHSRFFAPVGGVNEDPATGSAAVALAAVLEAQGEGSGSVVISQGDEMGAPSTIQLSWAEGRASIGGTVVSDEARLLDV